MIRRAHPEPHRLPPASCVGSPEIRRLALRGRRPRRRCTRASVLVLVGLLGLGPATAASAQRLRLGGPPVTEEWSALPAQVALGRPARPVSLSMEGDGSGAVTLVAQAAGRRLTEPVAAGGDARGRYGSLTLADGSTVALIEASDAETRRAYVLGLRAGRPVLLWRGRVDLHGDPGERRADAWRLLLDPEGRPRGLAVGEVDEAVSVCGAAPALLRAQTLTSIRGPRPGPLPWPPVESSRATAQAVEADEGPVLVALRFRSASSAAPDAPVAALGDGDPDTAWQPADDDPRPFATARTLEPSLPIERLEFSFSAPLRAPRELTLVGSDASLAVTIPAGARTAAIAPPEPLLGRCLSLVLESGATGRARRAPRRPATTRPTLTEVRAFTPLDRRDGRLALLGDLAEGGPRRARAERLLRALGRPALRALLPRFGSMPADERRSVLRIAESTPGPERDELYRRALEGPSADVARAALNRLGGRLPDADALAQVVGALRRGDEVAVEAAELLARRAPGQAFPALLRAVVERPGVERLRRALRRSARALGADETPVAAWAATDPDPSAAAVVLLALSGEHPPPGFRALLSRTLARASEFTVRYRLALALAGSPQEAAGDAWLVAQAANAEEWMQRELALRALGARRSPSAASAALAGLEDGYPRVRARAALLLAGERRALVPLATLARRDHWPAVRAAAVEALSRDPDGVRILRAALRDPSKRVRATAAQAVGEVRDRASIPLLIERLESSREWPVVLIASAAALTRMCAPEAVPPLIELVRRARRPDAWEPDAEVAARALTALGALATEDARAALSEFARAPEPALADAARRALAHGGSCR